MSAKVNAGVGPNLSGGALPKMEALPADLFSQITFDYSGFQDSRVAGTDLASAPDMVQAPKSNLAAPTPSLRQKFDAISVRVPFNGKFFDVAVPNEMFDKSRRYQTAIAVQIGGKIGTRDLNRAVVNYLLDREAFDLLAKEKAGTITNEQTELLKLHREKWTQDKGAETRAKGAGAITEKEAALLDVYRRDRVRDTAGGLDVDGVRVLAYDDSDSHVVPNHGALVVCPSAESK